MLGVPVRAGRRREGKAVRVLTACMHYFHATCVEAWLHRKANCPLCRTPAMVVAV